MEIIKLDYDGTGIKVLRITSVISLILSFIATFILVVIAVKFNDNYQMKDYTIYPVIGAFFTLISGLFIYSVCMAFATIAENALYQKEHLKFKAAQEGIAFEKKESQY